MTLSDFLKRIENVVGNEGYKTKRWVNYPDSVFFYRKGDEDFRSEIGIYTSESAWGLYV